MLMRSAISDGRTGPFENLVNNPKFARAISGTSIIRRNFIVNPLPASSAGWGGANGATYSYDAAKQAIKITPVTTVTNSGLTTYNAPPPVRGVYTLSFDIESEIATTYLITGTAGWGSSGSYGFSMAAGEKRRVTRTLVGLPTTGALYVIRNKVESGGSYWVSKVTLELGLKALPFFYGNTVDNTAIAYSWEGTQHGSVSVAKCSTLEIRKNLFVNPEVNSGAGLAASSGQATLSTVNGIVRWTMDTTSGIGVRIVDYGGVTLGASYRMLIRARANRNLTVTPRISNANGSDITLGTAWQWIDYTTIVVTDSVNNTGLLLSSGHAIGDWIEIDRILIALAPDSGGWFSGNESDDEDLIPSWTGTPDNSASILSGISIYGNTTSGVNAFVASVMSYDSDGKTWIKQIPRGNGGPSGFFGLMPDWIPGRTYTIIVTKKLIAPLLGDGSGSWARLEHRLANGTVIAQAPRTNVAGVEQLRLVTTIQNSSDQVRFNHRGPSNDSPIYWSDVAVIEGDYRGPFISGDSPSCVWRGTPHISHSVGYPKLA